ncbi:protein ITPRID2 isoform X1 [Astyanax mexicanus]|uniref:protein ITPRID2 isoform X1 n=1 Tax=Astyanax mexicanus TaxID=7994 RepID=UPI0020CAF684|nr:protein ITPRID2 isoform X1 [Astyanax mexicanus]XP_049340794.1 protein ITPRID2 isoform X1 [Astyanax mexicanus]
MEECELSPAGRQHPWKTASLKRMAWAQSRDSWPSPETEEQSPDELLPTPATEHKPGPAETGPIPSKIASWLRECRTPLGASLDDQSSTPSKGLPKNGCSFEDDLSLGAEANHLQSSSTKPDDPGFSMPAKEKRSQFRQKGRSMNSTGSGKSSGTVSSVSELLDLYEEDPEEILYNLGFGREEPDIASKIPSRFFNASSGAKGIDIKVYLGAQMQRMELENPNYALTSRFRQTEVLATVANVFSEIYSQVSGRPLQKIGTKEAEPNEPLPLRSNSSALNAVKILKKSLTRPNLLNSAEGGASAQSGGTSSTEGTERGHPQDPHSDSEHKPPKVFRKKDSSSPLATVTEESVQLSPQGGVNGVEVESVVVNGDSSPVVVSVIEVSEQSDGVQAGEAGDQQKSVSSSTPDRDVCSLLPNPHIAHLLNQPRDSFEMEELQSIDGEAVCGTRCISRAGSESLLRTASQQSDSSGFAEDPSTDGSANYLKVQESSDSCDSETTVTSHAGGVTTPVALDHPAFEKLQGEEDDLLPGLGPFGLAGVAEDIPDYMAHQVPRQQVTETDVQGSGVSSLVPSDRLESSAMETSSSIESGSTVTVESEDLESSTGADVETSPEGEVSSTTENASLASAKEPAVVPWQKQFPEYRRGRDQNLSTSERVRHALLRAEQRSSSMCDDRVGRVWIRRKDLLKELEVETRNPLRRSSSLPNSLLGPTRVVSSMRIQLGQGSVRHCTPPCYSYKYEEGHEGDEVDSIAEEDDEYPEEAQSRCRSSLLVKQASTDCESTGLPPYGMPPYPLNVPQHLTRSANSLYSTPADWPLRRLAEGPSWSTSSVPDLTNPATMPHVPPASQQGNHHHQHLPHYRAGAGSAYHPNKAGSYPSHGATPGSFNSPPTHQYTPYAHLQDPSSIPHSLHTPPHGVPYPHPNMPSYFHPHSAPYGPPAPPMHSPYHPPPPLHAPYGSTFNLHGSLYHPYSPLSHSHSAPHNLGYNNTAPYHPHGHYQCTSPFTPPPPAQFPPYDTATPPPAMGSTEMQLRRVLHEIRGTVQSLNQSPSVPREGTPLGTQSPHQPIQPLYEELQMRRRSLNVFRTQMMDLELSLMRQQSMVYQHFGSDERREAEHLLRLRAAVRQELQDLELQLEDRLLTINDQQRSTQHSRLCRHPLGMSRGHSMDSLSSSSALRAMEPVTDLLREQLYLQSELGYDGALSAAGTPLSGRSSRAESPSRSTRTSGRCSPAPQRGGVYRSTVSITPSVPPRPGAELSQPATGEVQEETTPPHLNPDPSEVRAQRGECLSASPMEEQESTANEDPQSLGEGGGGGGGHAHLQQLIQEIKQSLAEEIRQEIVNELLAAVSPRPSSRASREPPP